MGRIDRVKYLAEVIKTLSKEELIDLTDKASNENPWFTPESVKNSLSGISHMLAGDKLNHWLDQYSPTSHPKKVGLVMAGNIPMVGFHDLLCVYLSGHQSIVKLSHQDKVLMKWIIGFLLEEDQDSITLVDQLSGFEAVIATGSSNSSRYFNYYFGKYPHIIRKNRTSVGIIGNDITDEALVELGRDVFSYFGLGCRNVSSLRVPESFNLERLGAAWSIFSDIIHHHKYANNYDYNKSILLVNREEHLDFGYALLKPSPELFSPISVIHYDFYSEESELDSFRVEQQENIQCMVGREVDFGKAQLPELWDYADGVDTMKFLQNL